MTWTHRCLIVTSATQILAQTMSYGIAGDSGKGMWTSGCSPTGTLPATHYITEGCIHQGFADLLSDANLLYAQVSAANVMYLGIPITLLQCQTLLNTGDISTNLPFDALARLGLKLIL